MKLILTEKEAHSVIKSFYELTPEVQVEITKHEEIIIGRGVLDDLIMDIDALRHGSDQKIEAIKCFRSATGEGLLNTKRMIERWPKTRAFILRERRVPKISQWGDSNQFDLI